MKKYRKDRGFNLIEAIIAMWVIALSVLMTLGIYTGMSRMSAKGISAALATSVATELYTEVSEISGGNTLKKIKEKFPESVTVSDEKTVNYEKYFWIMTIDALDSPDEKALEPYKKALKAGVVKIDMLVAWGEGAVLAKKISKSASTTEDLTKELNKKLSKGKSGHSPRAMSYGKPYMRFSQIVNIKDH